jgi:hypothetical protein
MKFDEIQVPADIDVAVRQASTVVPGQAWDLDALRARARSARRRARWRWRRRVAGIVAGAVAVIAAGSATVILGTGSGPGPADGPRVLFVYAGDADHLYADQADCTDCPETLLGSDDGGVTWTRRTDHTDPHFRLTAGPTGALLVEGYQFDLTSPSASIPGQVSGTAVSNDGGHTWRPLADDPTPWGTVPTGGILSCDQGTGCPLGVIDPATGRKSPLAQQPPDNGDRHAVAVRGVVWIDSSGSSTQQTTVSRDGGNTWSTKSEACVAADCGGYPLKPGLDGSTVYRVRFHDPGGETVVRRSTDAGATWRSFTVTGAAAVDAYGGTATGLVAPDGSLIVIRLVGSGVPPECWILRPGDSQLRPAQLTGLPDHIGAVLANSITGNADTGYLIHPEQGDTAYRSLDGLAWRPMVILAQP